MNWELCIFLMLHANWFGMHGRSRSKLWNGGTYSEIVPLEKLVYIDAFADEAGNWVDPATYGIDPNFPKTNTVTVTFEELDGKTQLTILYIAESEAVLESMRKTQMKEGWESSLEKLALALPK